MFTHIRNFWRRSAEVSRREQEKNFQINFPLVERAAPFSVSVKLSSYGRVYQHILNISATGAAHPYDPDFMTGNFGDDNKNPALLPALRLLRNDLPVIAKAAMEEAGLSTRAMSFFDAQYNNGEPETRDHSTGLYCLMRFNPCDHTYPNHDYKAATPKQIEVFYESIVAGLKILEPALRKVIAVNLKDYPPIPLDQVAVLTHHARLETEHLRIMLAAGAAPVAHDDLDIDAMVRIAQQQGTKEAHIARTDAEGRITGLIRATLQRRFG